MQVTVQEEKKRERVTWQLTKAWPEKTSENKLNFPKSTCV